MAEKTVVVRLRALVDDYKRGMADAAKATDAVTSSSKKFDTLGSSMTRVGDAMTTRVTLPLVAVGAAALKMSADFDQVFTQMQSLAGVSADEVDGLKQSVLDLAGDTGRAPKELADALYFLRSSGLEGAAAMDALEMSAKASAAGLGSTATIADAVSSAMNAYAREGLKAAEATDVLVATARAGKAEPEQLAASLGQVLPVASELGITFADVGGAVASLSLSGNDAARSSTLLTNILSKLLKPSQQGAEALEAVGLSVDGIRSMIAEKGLLGTLETLKSRLGDAGFVKFMEDAQAVQGALALTGQNADKVKDVFDQVADSAGATENAFSTWAESMGAKNQRAWAQLQTALIQMGDIIAPIAAQLADAVSSVAEAFSALPSGVQKGIVYFAMFAAAAGPVMSIGGRILQAWSAVGPALSRLSGPIGSASTALDRYTASGAGFSAALGKIPAAARMAATGIAALGVALAGLEIFNTLRVGRVSDELKGMTDGLDVSSLDGAREALSRYRAELDELDDREGKGRMFSVAGVNAFITNGDADRQERIDQLRDKIEELEGAEESLEGQQRSSAAAFAGTTGAVDDMTNSTVEAVTALQAYADELTAQFDPLFGMMDALQGNAEAQAAVTEAQHALNEAVATYGATSPEAAEAQAALTEAQRQATGSALDVTSATAQLNSAIAANPALLASSKAQLATWVDQGLITQSTADAMGAKFDATALKALALGRTDPNVDVSATDRATSVIDTVKQRLFGLDGQTAEVSVIARVKQTIFGISPDGKRAAGGPVAAGRLYEVAERGRAELLQMGGSTYLIPGANGTVIPADGSAGRAVPAGGGMTVLVDMRGAVVSSEMQFDRMVAKAFSRMGDNGRPVTYRGRRVA